MGELKKDRAEIKYVEYFSQEGNPHRHTSGLGEVEEIRYVDDHHDEVAPLGRKYVAVFFKDGSVEYLYNPDKILFMEEEDK